MLRRTKNQLIESGTLVLLSLTEITVSQITASRTILLPPFSQIRTFFLPSHISQVYSFTAIKASSFVSSNCERSAWRISVQKCNPTPEIEVIGPFLEVNKQKQISHLSTFLSSAPSLCCNRSCNSRKALAVEEKSGDKNDEPCTSSSSSESDSSEDEKGLLCLFSQEDSNEELCLMAEEEEVTSQNHSSNYSSESTYHENPREAFERMMKSFDDIEDSRTLQA
nr:lisH domain-containing protein C1711.05-like [Ipomoea batatas]